MSHLIKNRKFRGQLYSLWLFQRKFHTIQNLCPGQTGLVEMTSVPVNKNTFHHLLRIRKPKPFHEDNADSYSKQPQDHMLHTNDKFIVHVWSESLYSINTDQVLHWAVSWLSGAWQWGFCPVEKWCHILSGLLWMHQHFPPHRLSAGSAAKNMSEQQFIGEHRKLYWVVRQICP